jgi:hypothetical protein
MKDNLLACHQCAVDTTAAIKSAVVALRDPGISTEDTQAILIKKYKQLQEQLIDLKKIVEPVIAADTLAAWKVEPPANLYHQFDRYLSNHYEQIREITSCVYAERPDIEFAVIYYGSFPTAEDAREHRIQHAGEFRMEPITIENAGVTLLGPFKENRDRIDFYSKNTEIMKQMMDQVEKDHKLGKDIMEKAVKIQKKKNIKEAGPDAPGIKEYIRCVNKVRELGAKDTMTKEERKEMEEAVSQAKVIKEDYEVPEDAIQTDVFYNDGGKMRRKKLYTQAEAPLHLQDGSPYVDSYQPVNKVGTKTIIGRDGKKHQITICKEVD